MAFIRCGVSLGLTRVEEDYPLPDGWNEMTEKEKETMLDDWAEAMILNHVDSWAKIVEK